MDSPFSCWFSSGNEGMIPRKTIPMVSGKGNPRLIPNNLGHSLVSNDKMRPGFAFSSVELNRVLTVFFFWANTGKGRERDGNARRQGFGCPCSSRHSQCRSSGGTDSSFCQEIWPWVNTVLGSHFGIHEFTTHLELILVVGLGPVHWGYDLGFDP